MSGDGYVNVGEAGVGWVLDDPSTTELHEESDEVSPSAPTSDPSPNPSPGPNLNSFMADRQRRE